MSYTELDSILGQPLPQYVLNQLRLRSQKTLNPVDEFGIQGARDNASLVYTGNKSAWIRVISSIDIKPEYATSVNARTGYTIDSLAKKFVLFGGTSAYFGTRQVQQIVPDLDADFTNDYKDKNVPNYDLYPYFDENLLDRQVDQEYGFRPMVGITSAKIVTQGKLGSILQAEIDFKVNTKRQLDIVDILYFKLGYTMFVEWGNTFFFKQQNPSSVTLEAYPTIQKSEDYAVDPFEKGIDSEKLQIKIAQAIRQTEGNYCAMVGIVTNFNFSMNTEGGYDCKIKIIGKGLLAESMRANAVPALPEVYKDAITKIANLITTINKNKAEAEARKKREEEEREDRERLEREKNDPTKPENYPPCIKQYLDVQKFKIVTIGQDTYAEQNDPALNLGGFGFFANSTGNKYFKTAQNVKTFSTYKCSNGEILDTNGARILAVQVSAIAKPDKDIIAIIKNNTADARYKRTLIADTGRIGGFKYDDKNKTVYSGQDTGTVPPEYKNYFILDPFDKIIYAQKGSRDDYKIVGKLVVNLNTKIDNIGDPNPKISWEKALKDGYRTSTFLNLGKIQYPVDNNGMFWVNYNTIFQTYQEYVIEYRSVKRGHASKTRNWQNFDKPLDRTLIIQYDNNFREAPGVNYSIGKDTKSTRPGSIKMENTAGVTTARNGNVTANFDNNRDRISERLAERLSAGTINWEGVSINPVTGTITVNILIIVPGLPYVVTKVDNTEVIYADTSKSLGVLTTITTNDFSLITKLTYDKSQTPTVAPTTTPSTGTTTAGPLQYTYETVTPQQLQDSEAALYKSQLEAMLRTVQMTTISDFMNSSTGEISEVKYIDWTDSKHSKLLYNIFEDGALGNGHLKTVITNSGSILTNDNIQNYYKDLAPELRYQINLYCGFHRGLMKDTGIDNPLLPELAKPDSEYRVRFSELLRSYVVPYYQNKNLVEGGDIHYPTYVTLGYFFMMLNHCSFLYNTTDKGINIPITYLDFNQGSNIILSSDFMLSANPYRFVVPFRGNLDSYKKLFSARILTKAKGGKGDEIIAVDAQSKPTKLWTTDALSKYLPPFKFTTNNQDPTQNYRGKLMNALVSIDYLLDIIKVHATRDETNSVYVRSLLDEILSDLGKSLGNYNVLRLAYDDSANCFYVVDDQSIPGAGVYYPDPNIVKTENYDLPVFGKTSIAKAFTIQTDNSSKLASQLAISANSEVTNQSTAGIDATSVGNSSLYAEDRYKKALTTANDNSKNISVSAATASADDQRRAIAATKFNNTVDSFYRGGSRSEDGVEQATNYYIESVARTRNSDLDPEIKATMLLPLTVNFSTDGISGMRIQNAFTIPENLLPYSYTVEAGGANQSYTKRVGFVVTGLEHTLQGNTWTTDVKANMYYVKNKERYKTKPADQSAGQWRAVPKPVVATAVSAGAGGNSQSNTFGGTVPQYKDKAQAKAAVWASTDEIEAMKIWTRATEGYAGYVYWDISNWRTGYGSGNITLAGSNTKIELDNNRNRWVVGVDRAKGTLIYKDITGLVDANGKQMSNGKVWKAPMSNLAQIDVITAADAEADLERRIKQDFLPRAVFPVLKRKNIDWNTLSIPMKVAFFKTSYAYGNLTDGGAWIVNAYKSGGEAKVIEVAAAKAAVPNNSDYGAGKTAYLLQK